MTRGKVSSVGTDVSTTAAKASVEVLTPAEGPMPL